MKIAIPLPQSMADDHTIVAQRYAGWFIGHPFRAAQQRTGPGAIQVEWERPWKEPAIVADSCEFCLRLTDDDAIRRVAGFQHAIDIEVLRSRAASYAEWLASGSADVPDIEEIIIAGDRFRRGVMNSARNRRRFIETHPESFDVGALPVINMPLRLKRKLCIEWNHMYVQWMRDNPGTWYDFDSREFYREVEEPEAAEAEQVKSWWGMSNPFMGG